MSAAILTQNMSRGRHVDIDFTWEATGAIRVPTNPTAQITSPYIDNPYAFFLQVLSDYQIQFDHAAQIHSSKKRDPTDGRGPRVPARMTQIDSVRVFKHRTIGNPNPTSISPRWRRRRRAVKKETDCHCHRTGATTDAEQVPFFPFLAQNLILNLPIPISEPKGRRVNQKIRIKLDRATVAKIQNPLP